MLQHVGALFVCVLLTLHNAVSMLILQALQPTSQTPQCVTSQGQCFF